MNAKTLLALGFAAVSAAASAADVTVCSKGGTNDPYTAANPLVCDNFTFAAGVPDTTVERKPDSLASFTSGTHWIYGTLLSPGDRDKYTMTGELLITGKDTVVTANEVTFKNARTAAAFIKTVDGEPFNSVLRVTDGAKLVVSNAMTFTPSIAYDQYFYLDHATLDLVNGRFEQRRGENGTNYVYMTDSTVNSPKTSLAFTTFNSGWNNFSGLQVVRCTNTTFSVAGLYFSYGTCDAEFHNCTFPVVEGLSTTTLDLSAGANNPADPAHTPVPRVCFKDCTFPHLSADIGWINAEAYKDRVAHLIFDGGKVYFDKLQIGRGRSGQGPAHVTLTNGVDVTLGFNELLFGDGATSRLDVAGTTLVISNTLYLGKQIYDTNVNGGGILNVYDGANVDVYHTSTYKSGGGTIYIGGNDSGEVNVYGGALSARDINLPGNSYPTKDLSKGTFLLRQTGGVITAYSKAAYQYCGLYMGTVASAHTKAIFDGGRFLTAHIAGGPGESVIEANGGTIVAMFGAANQPYSLISGITHVRIGPKGLNIEVGSKVINNYLTQAMENMDGEEGVVRKTGDGILKFQTADADWTVARTVVSDGTLQIANATMALTGTELVTTNSGVLSVQGDGSTDGMTAANLKLSGGAIALDDGEVIQVTDGFSATAATGVQLTTPPTLEDKTGVKVITVAAGVTISPETKSALAKPSKTGRTTAKGKAIFGYLDVRAGANGTQEIWYTERRFRQGLMVVVR